MSAQVRPGYKLTEIGVIPEDWDVQLLKNCCTRLNVGFVGTCEPFYTNKSQGVMLIRTGNLQSESFRFEDMKFVTPEFHKVNKKSWVAKGDILIARHGSSGSAVLVPEEIEEANTLNIVIISTEKIKLNNVFAVYAINSSSVKRQVLEVVAGSTQSVVNTKEVAKLLIPLPSLVEQRAIAVALSDIDALISGLDQLIAKKRDIKQAAMQQLLTGQQRLPGFSGEWEVKTLGELSLFRKGKGLPKSELSLSGVDPCIHYGELFTQYPETIGKIISRTNGSRDAFRSIANDVLMPTSDVTPRGLAKASCITIDGVILGGDILIIRSDTKKINGSFLSYVIRHNEDQILQLVTGSTVFHLYGSDMKRFTFSTPPVPEQTAIAAILSDMDSELAALETRRDKARQLKQGMMQELLTGNIRIN